MLSSGQDLRSTGGWLSARAIQDAVKVGSIVISPFSLGQLNPNSYNYCLSPQIRRLSNKVVDAYAADEYEMLTIPDEGLILEPGECYLGSTSEVFGSATYAALITGRSSVGRKFITNHVTAGLVDIGFIGNLTLEIVVGKRTRIYPKMMFGQIFWFTLWGDPSVQYSGKYQGQSGPTESRLALDAEGRPARFVN